MGSTVMSLASREPVVAGTFYPAEPERVARAVDRWFTGERPPTRPWRAALVPHAGWMYSGALAAQVLARIAFPPTVVVLCPKHRAGGASCAVAPWGRWLFPGGSMEVDGELSQQFAAEVPGFVWDHVPHVEEHAIEVLLPIIARLAPATRLVAITIGRADLEQIHLCGAAMAEIVRDRLDTMLFVVSSDMNHFANERETRRHDALALEALEALDPDRLYATCLQQRISMCGMVPAAMVLSALCSLNALHCVERVGYATSRAVSGDAERVVGYAGMLFE
jgi:AmmeMemoRadiSam system protein B